MTKEDELIELRKSIRDECRSSLLFLAKNILGYKDLTEYTHGEIIQTLENEGKRKLIVCPRGSFKSSLCVVSYSIWRLIRDPNERILIDSELYQNSKNFLREIKGHFQSELFIKYFGEWKTKNQWTEGSLTVSKRTKNYKEASITCSGLGAEKTGQHYSTVILDDVNSPNNSQSHESRQKVIDHFRYTQSILDPGGSLVVVGTRYAADDLPGFILRTEGLEK